MMLDKTMTIIGTPHYMAPEMVLGDGYTFSVDIWSLAVSMFELCCGFLPFGDNLDNPMEIYVEIMNKWNCNKTCVFSYFHKRLKLQIAC